MGKRQRHLRAACLGLALGLLAACADQAEPTPEWPMGAWLTGRRQPLGELLELLTQLEGTPLARRARVLSEALPDCAAIEAQSSEAAFEPLLESLRCADDAGPLAALRRSRGPRDLSFAWPLAPDLQLRGHATVGLLAGEVALELAIPDEALRGPRALLLPDREPPGPPLLSRADGLVQARLRPEGGIDLSGLARDGQAASMFALRDELFTAALLDGTWEVAVYLPDAPGGMPRAALALGVRDGSVAALAAEHFLARLAEIWPLEPAAFEAAGASGSCLSELRVLPDLAPCYVATRQALVVGWNASSVRKALAGGPPAALPPGGGLLVDLARFPRADVLLGLPPGTATTWPWRQLRAGVRRTPGQLELRAVLSESALDGLGA